MTGAYLYFIQRWISRNRTLTAGLVAFVGTGGLLVWLERKKYNRKRRARRASNGARREVVGMRSMLKTLKNNMANMFSYCWPTKLTHHKVVIARPRKTRLHRLYCVFEHGRRTAGSERVKGRRKAVTFGRRGHVWYTESHRAL